MIVAAQKALTFFLCFFMLAGAARSAQPRTWTFSQDGQMKTSSGGTVSFKKKGRIDAAFVRVENTNSVILLAGHGDYLTIATTNLSISDRSYVVRETGIDQAGAAPALQAAITRNEISRRRVEAARLNELAAGKRRQGQTESEAADGLEERASKLSSRAQSLKLQAVAPEQSAGSGGTSSNTLPAAPESILKASGNAAIAGGAADQLEQDAARLRGQVAEKRQKAARLEKEAADLERTAQAEIASIQQLISY